MARHGATTPHNGLEILMALGATIHRAELELADIDRGVYGSHTLTLARHPSETEERLMLRLLAWAMFSDQDLEFGRGISTEEDPDLWLRHPDGTIELWIEMGLPEEKRLRRAAGRARQVIVFASGGRAVPPWWARQGEGLRRIERLRVLEIPQEQSKALAALCSRNMRLHCTIQEGQVLVGDATQSVLIVPECLHPH
jgi:uncharacterized protein YaeQ